MVNSGVGDRLPDLLGARLDVDLVELPGLGRGRGHGGSSFLEHRLEVGERRRPLAGVLADPAVGDQLDRDGIEEVELLATGAPGHDHPRSLQDPQVLHDPEPAHLHPLEELGERAAVALEEPVEEVAPGGVGQRPEDPVVVHDRDYK